MKQELLEKLATQFHTTAEHLWDVLVGYAPMSGTINFVSSMVLFGLSLMAFRLAHHAWQTYTDRNDHEIVVFLAGIASALGFGVGLLAFESGIQGIFYPEMWALQKLLYQLK